MNLLARMFVVSAIGLCKRGCDVSREAADIILLGDTFASIVTAIGTGNKCDLTLEGVQ